MLVDFTDAWPEIKLQTSGQPPQGTLCYVGRVIWGSLVNYCHPGPRRAWTRGRSSGSWHHFAGHRGRTRTRLDLNSGIEKTTHLLGKLHPIEQSARRYKVTQCVPKGSHRCPKMAKDIPKDGQREPGAPQGAQEDQRERQSGPKATLPGAFRLTFWPRFYHSWNYLRSQA